MPAPEEAATGTLDRLEQEARERGWLLRLQVNRPLGLRSLRLVVLQPTAPGQARLLGELKAWAYPAPAGLQLDTMRVAASAPPGVGDLIWAATFAWSLEATPCRRARLLAIRDDERRHARLVRYFRQRGFQPQRSLGAALWDLPLRMVWGGAGLLMSAPCDGALDLALRRWRKV
ncbi:hypothetical protein EVJ50_01640 [Synechococcus sp. RSCCF101]|uniref:hypothetical protein n=1 Tax=Synechococcus sp. RSCCF101 TaxID=2511069 RepID=UPI00124684F8|nr:hypothetical protein [Synechococcus sp. RSCCF101]QEY31145.1 hypothetical protein EVJ50_01640 [Synechococcus sp. RSCCF101]